MKFFSFFLIMILSTQVNLSQDTSNEGFARYLFTQGEYYRAITEYYKILYTITNPTEKTSVLRKMALCHYYGADYDGCVAFIHANRNIFLMDTNVYSEMNLFQGKCYYHLGLYSKSISILENVHFEPSDSLYDEKYFTLGLSYAHLYDWETSFKNIEQIKRNKTFLDFRDYLISQKGTIRSFAKRDPTSAGILSAVLPGAGYIYCDRITTGITSFIVNGLLFWSAIDAARNKQYGLSAAIGFFGIGWYIGNISGSISAAHQFNSSVQDRFLNNSLMNKNILNENE